jgi:hypothetical protein
VNTTPLTVPEPGETEGLRILARSVPGVKDAEAVIRQRRATLPLGPCSRANHATT